MILKKYVYILNIEAYIQISCKCISIYTAVM